MKFNTVKPVILASTSPRRREILSLLGFPFTVVPSNISEELEIGKDSFQEYAQNIAAMKTQAVVYYEPSSIIIGADTIVVHEGKLYPKPKSENQAKQFLKEFSGKTHTVITGVGIFFEETLRTFAVETEVTFRKLDDSLIDSYVKSGDPMDKAGGYGIQTAGALLVEKIDGDYYNVMGLPISKLTEHMRGIEVITLSEGESFIDY